MNIEEFFEGQKKFEKKINPDWLKGIQDLHSKQNKIIELVNWAKFLPNIKAITSLQLSLKATEKYIKAFDFIANIRGAKISDQPPFSNSFIKYYRGYELLPSLEFDDETERTHNEIIVNETQQIKRIITDIYKNNNTLYSLTSRKFEEVIAELLHSQGLIVELTKQTKDGGYDILAIQNQGLSPIKYLVECKKYAKKNAVGVEIIRAFSYIVKDEDANKGIIVTTSYFSPDAVKKREKNPYLLDFRDKDKVIEWVEEYVNTS